MENLFGFDEERFHIELHFVLHGCGLLTIPREEKEEEEELGGYLPLEIANGVILCYFQTTQCKFCYLQLVARRIAREVSNGFVHFMTTSSTNN